MDQAPSALQVKGHITTANAMMQSHFRFIQITTVCLSDSVAYSCHELITWECCYQSTHFQTCTRSPSVVVQIFVLKSALKHLFNFFIRGKVKVYTLQNAFKV